MSRKFIYILISGTGISRKTLAENLTDLSIDELKEIALLLEKEYGITLHQKEEEQEPTLEQLFELIAKQDKTPKKLVFEKKPDFPIPKEIFLTKNKKFFVPQKIGKINSKPKGKYRK